MLIGGGGEGGGEGGGGQIDLGHRGDAGGRAESEADAGAASIDASLGSLLLLVRLRRRAVARTEHSQLGSTAARLGRLRSEQPVHVLSPAAQLVAALLAVRARELRALCQLRAGCQ